MKRQKTFNNDNAKLYLVATPIGNLEDITFRAINTLKSVDLIYCEDTRTSYKLLKHYNINTPLKSYHLFNENLISDEIIIKLKEGKNIAVISDAGLPIISDPGYVAVEDAINSNIDVVIIPGASAGISALVASGLPAYKYTFVGFLNSKKAKRKQELMQLTNLDNTLIMYESPHRIEETLKIIDEVFKDREIVLARELTKIHEEYLRGTAREILKEIETIKGEIVLLIAPRKDAIDEELSKLSIKEHYEYYISLNLSDKDAIKEVAKDRNVSKKDIYDIIKK